MRGSKALAWTIAGVVVVSESVLSVLDMTVGSDVYSDASDVVLLPAVLATLAVGLLLALKRPHNPIGWLLLSLPVVGVIDSAAGVYAGIGLEQGDDLPGMRLAAAWYTHGWPLIFAPIVAIAFVFPDGRLPSARWRPVVIGGAIAFAVTLIGGLLSGDEFDEFDAPFKGLEPLGLLPSDVSGVLQGVGLLGMIATLIAAALALRARFRGADGVLRAQLKWITYAGAFIPLAIVAGTVDGVVFDNDPGLLTSVGLLAAILAVTAAIAIAVLRYRLYEIDRLISVTLVYGVLTALLAAAFAAISLAGGVALGGGSTVPTAAATLAVALAFRPLRAWVQALVDRRFNPERYRGLKRIEDFLAELRGGSAEPEAIGDVLAAAASDPTARLYFWLPRDETHADRNGRLVSELPAEPRGRTPVRRGELMLATLLHDPRLSERPGLLEALITRAGLAIEIARLRVEVRHHLAEVEASRARIVSAAHEERRRLERDLHDGAQQRLVSIGLDLRHLQWGLDDSDEARAGLDRAVAGLSEAIEELRELAHGMRPAALESGLGPALRDLAALAPVNTEVTATDERFDDELEAAAYFVASEGLTNAAKHARESRVVVVASRQNGKLVVSVSDDGPGGAAFTKGTGLTGLADRVDAVGGRIEITSSAGRGTRLTAEFPCEPPSGGAR